MQKKKVLVVGSTGRMGSLVIQAINNSEDFVYTAGYGLGFSAEASHFTEIEDFFTWHNPSTVDIIIDFSHPVATMEILVYAVKNHKPMVIATTGFSAEEEEKIEIASKMIPIFKSANMSYGVNAVIKLLKVASELLLDNYEVGIHETHHSQKKDAPSGTAKMFFDAINTMSRNELKAVYGSTGQKKKNEVWLSSQRCGNFPGEHIVTFAGPNDFIRIEHFANNPSIFAEGALVAARFLLKQTEPRIYTMDDMF